MKHGISTEIHAKEKYKSITRRHHKNITYHDPGMTISQDHVFISATPDLEINCSCHGKGLVEVKCPATVIAKTPDADNYSHLERNEGILKLKHTSPYYYQVQGQMGITNSQYVDFFVFSFEGHHLVRIPFNQDFWNDMKNNLVLLWKDIIAPEIIFKRMFYRINLNPAFSSTTNMIKVNKPDEINRNDVFIEDNDEINEILNLDSLSRLIE